MTYNFSIIMKSFFCFAFIAVIISAKMFINSFDTSARVLWSWRSNWLEKEAYLLLSRYKRKSTRSHSWSMQNCTSWWRSPLQLWMFHWTRNEGGKSFQSTYRSRNWSSFYRGKANAYLKSFVSNPLLSDNWNNFSLLVGVSSEKQRMRIYLRV